MSIPLLFFVFPPCIDSDQRSTGHRIPIKFNINIAGRRALVHLSVSGVQASMVSTVPVVPASRNRSTSP